MSQATGSNRLFRWLLIALITTVTLITITGIGALLAIKTESGRLWLLQQALNVTNEEGELEIVIDSPSSKSIEQWSAESLEIYVDNERLMAAQHLSLIWKPSGLWDQNFELTSVSIKDVDIWPLVFFDDGPDSEPLDLTAEFQYWRNLIQERTWGLILESLNIESVFIQVDADATGESEATLAVSMDSAIEWLVAQPLEALIDLEALGSKESSASLMLSGDPLKTLGLTGRFSEAPEGYISKALYLPNETSFEANFGIEFSIDNDQIEVNIDHLDTPSLAHPLSADGQVLTTSLFDSLAIKNLELAVNQAIVKLDGELRSDSIDLNFDVARFPLEILTLFLDPDLQDMPLDGGQINAVGMVTGKPEQPKFEAKIDANFSYNGLAFSGQTNASGTTKIISFDQIDFSTDEAKLLATGELDIEQQIAQWSLTANNIDSRIFEHFDVSVPDGLEIFIETIEAELQGSLTNPNGRLVSNLTGRYLSEPFAMSLSTLKNGTKISLEPAQLFLLGSSVGELTPTEESISTPSAKPESTGERTGKAIISGWHDIASNNSELDIELEKLPLQLLTLAGWEPPIGLSALLDGEFSLAGNIENPRVNGQAALVGNYQDIPIRLDVQGDYSESEIRLDHLTASTFDTQVAMLVGSLNTTRVDFDLETNRLPLKLLSAVGFDIRPGLFDADMSVEGSADSPEIYGQMHYQIQAETSLNSGNIEQGSELPDSVLSVRTQINTDDGLYQFDTGLEYQGTPSGDINVNVSTNTLTQYLNTNPRPDLSSLPIKANLEAKTGLESLGVFLKGHIHQLEGNLNANIDMSGTLLEPNFKGDLSVENVGYENRSFGTRIRDMNCSLKLLQKRIELGDCLATDGSLGAYALSGDVRLPDDTDAGSVDLDVALRDVELIKIRDLESTINGGINLLGDFDQVLLAGQLDASPLTVFMDTTASSVPEIQVRRVDRSDNDNKESRASGYRIPDLILDLRIDAEKQAYLRGPSDLEAELAGYIELNGPADDVDYSGEFNTLRGNFDLLGKTFTFDRGQVLIENQALGFDFAGTYSSSSDSITANISGTSDQLDLSFTSDPARPEDEILSYLLFGKSVHSMTAFEALTLVIALRELQTGEQSAFDPVSTARKALGVDRFSVDQAPEGEDNSGVRVGVGKYIRDNVYLELERSSDLSLPWQANISFELSPFLNLETYSSGTGAQGSQLLWKRHY